MSFCVQDMVIENVARKKVRVRLLLAQNHDGPYIKYGIRSHCFLCSSQIRVNTAYLQVQVKSCCVNDDIRLKQTIFFISKFLKNLRTSRIM